MRALPDVCRADLVRLIDQIRQGAGTSDDAWDLIEQWARNRRLHTEWFILRLQAAITAVVTDGADSTDPRVWNAGTWHDADDGDYVSACAALEHGW